MEVHLRKNHQLPNAVIYFVLFVCVAPFVLNLCGVDFSSFKLQLDIHNTDLVNHLFHVHRGAFTHALLEWSAFSVAVLTAMLAFAHYAIKRDPITPIVCLALLCAGVMDAFHTLAATRLIEAHAENSNLVPFTWAVCRFFNAIICLIGVVFVLRIYQEKDKDKYSSSSIVKIIIAGLCFALLSYAVIYYSSHAYSLPQTQFPNHVITRPWDIAPLFVFLMTMVGYKVLFNKRPNAFTHSLVVSTIPDIAVQVHMAFGSSALFDNHFNIAHFLKAFAYLIPFIGLLFDYVHTHRKQLASENSLKEQAQALKTAKENAEKANAAKSLFLANISHEVRTPMHGVLSFAELGVERSEEGSHSELKDFFSEILKTGHRLMSLLNDLLDLSKLETGKATYTFAQHDMTTLIDSALSQYQSFAQEKKVNLVTSYENSDSTAEFDEIKIYQVLGNLMTNAIKFSHEGTEIQLKLVTNGDSLSVFVENEGIPIPEDEIDSIFDAFTQSSNTRTNAGGTGLGLPICKKIIEDHGGSIQAECKNNKVTFSFKMPRNQKGNKSASE